MDVVDTVAVDVVVALAVVVGAIVAILLVVGVGAYVGVLLGIDATSAGLLVSTAGPEVVVTAGLPFVESVETVVAVPVSSAIVPGSQPLGPENQPVRRLAMSVA